MKLKELFKKVSVSGMLAAFALCMTTLAANSECVFVFRYIYIMENNLVIKLN